MTNLNDDFEAANQKFDADQVQAKPAKFRRLLQKLLGNILFPVSPDWYVAKGYDKDEDGFQLIFVFENFLELQKKEGAHFYEQFKDMSIDRNELQTKNCNGDDCNIEVVHFDPAEYLSKTNKNVPGKDKHIVYFCGANTYYQGCFGDITAAAKKTGATVHAFNYPGVGSSTGRVYEFNDLVNSGISVVNSLLEQGIKLDDIVLQGDCYGSAVAHAVKMQYKKQSNADVRIVVNNAFKSFKATLIDMVLSSKWIPNALSGAVKKLLEYTGWHVTLGKEYKLSDPYQCFVQHSDDQTLQKAKLSYKVQKYRQEAKSGKTTSKKRDAVVDTCPEEYKKHRDELDSLSTVHLSVDNSEKLGKKFGKNNVGLANSHFADLYQCEMGDGTNAYDGFVNKYLAYSNDYIKKGHGQSQLSISELPTFLSSSVVKHMLSQEDLEDMQALGDALSVKSNLN